MEERRLAEEHKKAMEELLAKQVRAVTLMQALYRGWRIRRAMARAKVIFKCIHTYFYVFRTRVKRRNKSYIKLVNFIQLDL